MTDVEVVVAAYIASAWRRPDTVVFDTPDWFENRTPSSLFGNHNSVRRCRLDPRACELRIRATQEHHRETGADIRWTVTPSCRPAELGELLLAAGFQRSWATAGMLRATEPLEGVPGDVKVSTVGAEDAERFAKVCGAAWSLPDDFMASIASDMVRYIRSGWMIYVIASIDGDDVGSSHVLLAPGSGYLMGGGVRPDARLHGSLFFCAEFQSVALASRCRD